MKITTLGSTRQHDGRIFRWIRDMGFTPLQVNNVFGAISAPPQKKKLNFSFKKGHIFIFAREINPRQFCNIISFNTAEHHTWKEVNRSFKQPNCLIKLRYSKFCDIGVLQPLVREHIPNFPVLTILKDTSLEQVICSSDANGGTCSCPLCPNPPPSVKVGGDALYTHTVTFLKIAWMWGTHSHVLHSQIPVN